MVQRVFISHSSRDKEMADTICKHLEEQGVACWIAPRNVPPGAKYGEAIVNAIEDALAIVFIFSEHSNSSEQVMNEIERSVSKKKAIFPIKASQIAPSLELEYFISRRHWLDLSISTMDETLRELTGALHALAEAQEPAATRGAFQKPEQLFVIEASREGERLKLSAHERSADEERPLRHYEYLEADFGAINTAVDHLVALLNRATDNRGTLDGDTWQEIRAHGEALCKQLLTASIRERLSATTAPNLLLHLDDALVHIPWELLFDGTAFLCRRFSIGRFVSTQQEPVASQERQQREALRMLIVANPQGNLDAAGQEGDTLESELAPERHRLQVELRKTAVDAATVKGAVGQCDVLHYAGHADYDSDDPARSGWLLADDKLTAAEILELGKAAPMPALVFCNACWSGQTSSWEIAQGTEQNIFGLANAFLLAGTQHYIGSLWEIPDAPSRTFAIEFYRALARETTVGGALRVARQRLIERYGEESVVWASYMLYGDPTTRYLAPPQAQAAPRPAARPLPASETSPATTRRKAARIAAMGIAAVLVLALGTWLGGMWRGNRLDNTPIARAYAILAQGDPQQAEVLFQPLLEQGDKRHQSQAYAGLAAVAFARRDASQTLDLAGKAEALDPDIVYSHVLRGNVLLDQGETAQAAAEYQTATRKRNGFPWQQAIAYNRLGRIYTAQGQPEQAMQQYDQALSKHSNGHRDRVTAFVNKAHLLAQLGKNDEALAQYRKAQQLAPEDRLITALLAESERRSKATADSEKQARIDKLVTDLIQMHRDGRPQQDGGDGWTSAPLTIAFLPLQTQGALSARAGEEDFLFLRLVETLQATGRITVIEREILDKILTELKLSASELVDPRTSVQVGRILAARLLVTGSLKRFGGEAQLSMRVVETESTRLKASVTEILDLPLGVDDVADQVAGDLLAKLNDAYPLQGRIVQAAPGEVMLNIGADQGVIPGVKLHVFGADEPIRLDGKIIGYNRSQVGLIEVSSVQEGFAQAKVLEQTTDFVKGWKVKEALEP